MHEEVQRMTSDGTSSTSGPTDAAERSRGTGPIVFSARGVSKSYPGVQALSGLDLDGRAGEVLAICGANGAGKSTFARLLAGQESPSGGEIRVTGHPEPVADPA
jgi:ABC-type sugar transport system ATPase subunit